MRKLLSLMLFAALVFILASGGAEAQEEWRITPQNLESVKEKAASGDPYYQAILGDAYLEGEVVMEDDEEGAKWTKLAAEENNPIALYNLGDMYKYGKNGRMGTSEGAEKGKKLYLKAHKGLLSMAKKGDARAQTKLFLMYRIGNGVDKDEEKALEWQHKAVDQGFCIAQFILGVDTQSENLPLAVELLEKAAEQDYHMAQSQVAGIYEGGVLNDGTQVPLSPEKVAYWYSRAASLGGAWGQVGLAEIYNEGKGTKVDKRKALRLYHQGVGKLEDRDKKYHAYSIDALDKETGLLLPIKIKWAGVDASPDNKEIEEKIDRAVQAYNAGMIDAYLEILNSVIDSNDVVFLYMDNYWYVFHQNNIPPSAISSMLQFVKYYNPEMKNEAGFWFDYAHNANLAGQPGLAIAGVSKLRETTGKSPDKYTDKEVEQWASILEANALIQLGKEKEAYDLLYRAGQLDPEDTWTVNYINHWAKPLLKDKKKLSFVTGVAESKWTGKYELPSIKAFHDMETGKLVKPVTEAPKLEKKPEPEAKEKPKKKKRFIVTE